MALAPEHRQAMGVDAPYGDVQRQNAHIAHLVACRVECSRPEAVSAVGVPVICRVSASKRQDRPAGLAVERVDDFAVA